MKAKSLFQINSKLYACGGITRYKILTREFVSHFFCFTSFGEKLQLSPMEYARVGASLSGIFSTLMAIGAYKTKNTKICEKYLIGPNKWEPLPPLNEGRACPGSLLLNSMKAFCFCGALSMSVSLNSIESLELESQSNWKALPLNEKVVQTFHLAATSFRGKILLFGGTSSHSSNML